jgi:hypothetical protein
VPIIAVCSFCRIGRVRAPEEAIGQTAQCPRCHAEFTVVDSGQPDPGTRPRPTTPTVPPSPAPVAEPVRLEPDPAATAVLTSPRPQPAPVPTPIVVDEDEAEPGDATRVAWIIALLLAGAGLIAAQIPYGRFVTVGATVIGALLAAAAAFGARKPVYPVVAVGLNVLVVLVALLLPGWLGLGSWRPTKTDDDKRTVQVLTAEGLEKPATEWVDVSQPWQFDDVRVKATTAVGPVELSGPKGKGAWSKKQYLAVRLKVGNVGVAREVPFQGWDAAAVKLTDAAGSAVPLAKFDPGWALVEANRPASLTPGKSADWLLVFELPGPTEYLRLDLPGAPAGVPDTPIRFQIPVRLSKRP